MAKGWGVGQCKSVQYFVKLVLSYHKEDREPAGGSLSRVYEDQERLPRERCPDGDRGKEESAGEELA